MRFVKQFFKASTLKTRRDGEISARLTGTFSYKAVIVDRSLLQLGVR